MLRKKKIRIISYDSLVIGIYFTQVYEVLNRTDLVLDKLKI